MIAPSKFEEFLAIFMPIIKAYVLNQNTILVAVNLNNVGMDEATANSRVFEHGGKKAYIKPTNIEELKMFGDEITPELIQRVRKAFDPDGALTEVPKKVKKLPERSMDESPKEIIHHVQDVPVTEEEIREEKPPQRAEEKLPDRDEETSVWKRLADDTRTGE